MKKLPEKIINRLYYQLGVMYKKGYGVEIDLEKSMRMMLMSAKAWKPACSKSSCQSLRSRHGTTKRQ